MKVQIATIVYGDYIDIFDKCCLRSLMQRGNIPHLIANGYEVDYTIYTQDNTDVDRLKGVVKKYDRNGVNFEVKGLYGQDNGGLLREIIRSGLDNDAPVLFLNPDYFFCDDALKNLIAYKFKNNTCLAISHVRVNDNEFLEKISKVKGNVPAPKLVSMAMECLHQSWSESFVNEERNNSFTSGSALQQIANKLWVATFRIPTVFMAKFNESDLEFLQRFDQWDHEWPTKLIDENRYKFVGSSDFFFAVELTSPQQNIPEVRDGQIWNDDFHVNRPHAEVNRNFVVTFRGN